MALFESVILAMVERRWWLDVMGLEVNGSAVLPGSVLSCE